PSPPETVVACPPPAQGATMFLLGVACTLIVLHLAGSLRWNTRPTEQTSDRRTSYRLDLNRATRAELMQLPGVGKGFAERIENYRQEHGSFRSVEDLRKVPGIGPKRWERLRDWVEVEDAEPEDEVPAQRPNAVPPMKKPRQGNGASKKEANLAGKVIDVNRAT